MFISVDESKQGEIWSEAEPGELWSGIRAGDQQALSGLFCLFYSPLFAYGCKLMARPGPVKDAIQELFCRLWEKRDNISEAHSVKSYLFYSLRRILLRTQARRQKRADRGRAYAAQWGNELASVEELMIHFETRCEQKQQLDQALKALSKRQREALFLKFYEGLSNREIAVVMQINAQSVYNHVSAAIGRLQTFVQVE